MELLFRSRLKLRLLLESLLLWLLELLLWLLELLLLWLLELLLWLLELLLLPLRLLDLLEDLGLSWWRLPALWLGSQLLVPSTEVSSSLTKMSAEVSGGNWSEVSLGLPSCFPP